MQWHYLKRVSHVLQSETIQKLCEKRLKFEFGIECIESLTGPFMREAGMSNL